MAAQCRRPYADRHGIRGAELFRQLFDRVDVLIVTEVGADVSGDVFFPKFERADFTEIRRESHPA